jgi:hypothetical protein
MGATSGPGTAYPSEAPELPRVFSWVRIARSLVFFVVFCRSLFGHCLSFDMWILITPLLSSNAS